MPKRKLETRPTPPEAVCKKATVSTATATTPVSRRPSSPLSVVFHPFTLLYPTLSNL